MKLAETATTGETGMSAGLAFLDAYVTAAKTGGYSMLVGSDGYMNGVTNYATKDSLTKWYVALPGAVPAVGTNAKAKWTVNANGATSAAKLL